MHSVEQLLFSGCSFRGGACGMHSKSPFTGLQISDGGRISQKSWTLNQVMIGNL